MTGDGAESCGSLTQSRSLDFILFTTEGPWQFFKRESDEPFLKSPLWSRGDGGLSKARVGTGRPGGELLLHAMVKDGGRPDGTRVGGLCSTPKHMVRLKQEDTQGGQADRRAQRPPCPQI